MDNTQELTDKVNTQEENANEQFDLLNEEDTKALTEMLGSQSEFFKPDEDVAYKITLNNSKVVAVEKEFKQEDGTIEKGTKYALNINATNAAGEKFNGIWEVGVSVLRPILKTYKEGVVYKMTKTGSLKNTKYNLIEDF